MAELQETLGIVIRRERQELGLTLKELAERSALSVVYLGEIERGKKYPSALVLERLAQALGLDVPDLLEMVAIQLRGERQPVLTIGFLPTTRRDGVSPAPRTGGRGQVVGMLVA
jgi:transcriptional regulator with XRE-family HTH domain